MPKIRVNYKSDLPPIEITFKVNTVEVDVPDHDFVLRFFVEGCDASYYCGCKYTEVYNADEDSETLQAEYFHCAPTLDGSKLTCYINNHKFMPGRLCVEYIDLAPDEDYEDGVKKTVVPDTLDVVLVDGVGDEVDNVVTDTFTYKVGRGILSVSKTGTVGVVDTYTITYDDGTTSTYTITNGRDGVDLGEVAIADDVVTDDSEMVLSARQGYLLNQRLESIETYELGSSSYDESDLIDGKMYITSVEVGDTITGELHAGASACMKLTTVKGDKVVVASKGGINARAYCVTNRNNVVIAVAASREDTTANPVELVANVDGYVYINSVDDEEALEAFAVTHYYSEELRRIEEVEDGVEMVNDRIDKLEEDVYVEEELEWTQHKYYNTNDNHTIGDNCPPKSGGANSDYDCLDVDLTQGFTKIEFSCKGHWSSAQHYQACAYFFLDSLNKIVGIADTSDYTYLENIYTLSLNPSDIPEGAVKLCLNNKTRGSYSYATPSCVITKIRGGGGTPAPVDTTDIIYLNPGAKNILNNVSLVKADGFATVLTMAHITDTHGDDGNMTRFNEFCSYYGIDTKLHTGDVLYQAYNLNDFDGTLFTDTMIAIGNHDTAHYEGGWNWTGHQGEDCYDRFIAPFASGWGITSVNDRCYYYKDFASKNIRLIVLDAMAHSTSQNDEQNTWFAARLADTLDSNNAAYGYDVIVAYHYIPSSIELFDFPFTSEFGIEGVASHSDVVDIVTSFITNGGKFIAWLTGHTHRDYCGKIVRTVNGSTINQVVLSAATGGTDASNQDCARVVDEKSQDLFSIYGIDTTRKLIKIYRIGCDCDVWCRHKETACINYETAEVVIDEEAKDNAPEANSEKGVKSGGVYTALAGKQATLVSGTNIKTINNQSLLGSGNINIQGGGGSAVQSDWNQSDSTADDYIKNKPSLATVATSGSYDDLDDKPTIPAAQVQSNWNESDNTSKAYIQNKPTIPTIPATATQSEINAGSSASQRTFTPQLLHDSAYIVEESYSSGSLKANKIYDFGTVSSALTIPSLDATNDLVSNALNFYALRFIAGADNLSITFPQDVIVDDEPTINTGDYVEIMINKYGSNFYASIKVWQTQ